jgi:hypothetical protein
MSKKECFASIAGRCREKVQRPVATKTRGVEAILLSREWVEKTAKMLTTQNNHSFRISGIC